MSGESNSVVTSILARCLVDPQFQRRLSRDVFGTLQNYSLSENTLSSLTRFEFRKLDLFGGLITQTQHNFLWESFPYSRALLKHYGIELHVFSAYRRQLPQGRTDFPRKKKIERFTRYLKGFLQGAVAERNYPGLVDVLAHERTRWELQQTRIRRQVKPRTGLPNLLLPARQFDQLTPVVPDNVRFARYRYDPIELGSALEKKCFGTFQLKPKLTQLVYRTDPATGQVSVFKTNSTVWHLFIKVNGNRRIGSILRATTSQRPKGLLRRYFEEACKTGMIQLRS